MAAKTVEIWLKCLLVLLGLVLIGFTLYAVLSLPESSEGNKKSPGLINKFIRNRRASESDCVWLLIAKEDVKTLTSPNYPGHYPNNADCRWLITTGNENASISIKIDTLSIEPEPKCRLDYLQVYLGSDTISPSLGPFCGYLSNHLIQTNLSTVLLVFRSDIAYQDAGFSIYYYIQPKSSTDCQELTTEASNWLTSPRFPENYPDEIDCSTLIQVEESKKIILTFDSLDLEYGDNCTFDYVQIFDGNNKNSSLLGQICQQTDSRSFESSSNTLLVHFHSDDSVNKKGYRARYSSVDARNVTFGNCLWESSEDNGTVSSPNYPENYPSFSNCSLWILAPEGHQINIVFESLLLEMETNCSYDFLQIKEGHAHGNKILGRFCGRGSEPKHLTSEGNELQIQFQSDDFVEFLGFRLSYEFLKVEEETNNEEPLSEEGAFSFSVRPKDATLTIGSTHALHCATRHPNAKIRWLKGDLFLAGEKPLPNLIVLSNNSLWIQNMGHHLVGLYSCLAVSPEGVITAKAKVALEGKQGDLPCKIDFRKIPIDSEFEEGSFAHLECLSIFPDARMSWMKDGHPILDYQDDGRITVLKNGYIFMDNVRREDAGLYTCVAQDPGTGCSKEVTAKLKVNAKMKIDDICGKAKIAEPARNISHRDHAKILGGYNTRKGAYPWQVMLWDPKRRSFCGATLLNERWIATAAHCLVNDLNIRWNSIRIKLGKHDRERVEEQELETSIADESAIVVHPGFDRFTYDNDLALIRMRHRISFTDYILPVCLGDRNLSERLLQGEAPRMGTVTGWGRLKEKGASPRYLQEIKLPVVDPAVCKESTTLSVTRNMFCAGYLQEVIGDACQGDSGGPFLMQHEGRWYMVGVVSWGEGCGAFKKYGFYTRIANHISWIQGVMKS